MTWLYLTLAGLALAPVAAELAARLWFRYLAGVYVHEPFTRQRLTTDPRVLPRQSPRIRYDVNSLGARGAEPPAGRGRTFHVLAAGGSAVECFMLDQDDSWPERVGRLLVAPENLARLGADRVHVTNLGRTSFTAECLCYVLPRVLPRHEPVDVLLVMIGVSAVNYWTGIGTPSHLPPPEPPWWYVSWHRERRWGWAPRRTALAELARRWRQVLTRPVQRRENTGRTMAQWRQLRAAAREVRDSYGCPDEWLARFEQALGRVVSLARPYARRVVLVSQPWFDKADPTPEEEALFWHGPVGDPRYQATDVYYSHRVLCELMRMTDAATERVGRAHGVEVIRPAEAVPASAETYYDHFHFTVRGAALLADYVADKILEGAPPRGDAATCPGHAAEPVAARPISHVGPGGRKVDIA
jgi:hypothetical protein